MFTSCLYYRHMPERGAESNEKIVLDALHSRVVTSPAARSVRSLPPNLFEPRTTIPHAAEPPARVPQPAARLQRDRGRTGALPLVGVKGFALLRFAVACG